eukprot:COSAG05_NODE_1125_length_5794_cov_6.018450_9_plen_37_part_01
MRSRAPSGRRTTSKAGSGWKLPIRVRVDIIVNESIRY